MSAESDVICSKVGPRVKCVRLQNSSMFRITCIHNPSMSSSVCARDYSCIGHGPDVLFNRKKEAEITEQKAKERRGS